MGPNRTIDLNADVGEAADAAGMEVERTLLGLVTSVHVACGGHAGDEESMGATVAAALEQGVRVGAHPSYPDRAGFGRRPMEIDRDELGRLLTDQVRTLDVICRAAGTAVASVKAHGALYEEVAKGGAIYETMRDAVRAGAGERAAMVLPSGCRAMAMALRDGMAALEEGFCDRSYRPDGGLVSRSEPGAVLADPAAAAAQALSLARGAVVADDGSVLTLWVDTLCIHGDSPGAVAIATAVRLAMDDVGINVVAPAACMSPSIPVGEVRRLGDRAFLIGVADAAAARLVAGELVTALGDEAEVVCGAATVMVRATDTEAELGPLLDVAVETQAEGDRPASTGKVPTGRLVTVACRFDGPDLDEVASLARCSPDEVVALLTASPLTAAVVGFSPGFAYLDGLPGPLAGVPRRSRPRPVVPAGSVAIANGHAAVYPTASPGGWHLVGRTGFALFSAQRPPYSVLAPGDRVQFTVAAPGAPTEPEVVAPPRWTLPPGARAVFEVEAPGLRAVVQDGGRHGVAAVGVPAAGPADPVSFELANRLTGNPSGAAAIELTGGGTRLRCLSTCHVAVVGAAPDVRVDGAAVPAGQLLPLGAGQLLAVGRQHRGCRTYVSVAGGVLAPEWFGSTATDELTGLGAGPLLQGDLVQAGAWAPPLGDHLVRGGATDIDPSSIVEVRVLPGPHSEQFAHDALTRLAAAVFTVQPESNRVGLRLRAERAATVRDEAGGGALDSQGVVTGAVQVPPDGDPVVLLPDHATLGGYPLLAVVISADHGLLGQCAPGTRLRLVPVTPGEAEEASRSARRERARAVAGTYPLAVD